MASEDSPQNVRSGVSPLAEYGGTRYLHVDAAL
jgi:hypothetical protein